MKLAHEVPSSLDEIRAQNPYQSTGFLQPLSLPGSSCAGISCFVINLFSYLCNPSAGFRFTLVGLSTDCLRLFVQLLWCLQASSELNNCIFVYHRSTHGCGQVITTAADRSVRLWSTPPSRSAPYFLVIRYWNSYCVPAVNFLHFDMATLLSYLHKSVKR